MKLWDVLDENKIIKLTHNPKGKKKSANVPTGTAWFKNWWENILCCFHTFLAFRGHRKILSNRVSKSNCRGKKPFLISCHLVLPVLPQGFVWHQSQLAGNGKPIRSFEQAESLDSFDTDLCVFVLRVVLCRISGKMLSRGLSNSNKRRITMQGARAGHWHVMTESFSVLGQSKQLWELEVFISTMAIHSLLPSLNLKRSIITHEINICYLQFSNNTLLTSLKGVMGHEKPLAFKYWQAFHTVVILSHSFKIWAEYGVVVKKKKVTNLVPKNK